MCLYLNNAAANILWDGHSVVKGVWFQEASQWVSAAALSGSLTPSLRDDYFYTALGDKKLFVDMSGLGENDTVKIINISDSALKTIPAMNVGTNFHDGYAKFLLHAVLPFHLKAIKIKLRLK